MTEHRSAQHRSSEKDLKRIGFFAPADSEYAQRLVDGVIRYQANHGGCVIRDHSGSPSAPGTNCRRKATGRPQIGHISLSQNLQFGY